MNPVTVNRFSLYMLTVVNQIGIVGTHLGRNVLHLGVILVKSGTLVGQAFNVNICVMCIRGNARRIASSRRKFEQSCVFRPHYVQFSQ